MAKSKIIFTCQECGYESAKWLGKCPDCAAWNSMIEEQIKMRGDRLGVKSEQLYIVSETNVDIPFQ